MPFKEHSLFKDPVGNNLILWRYIDFIKFISVLSRRSLFFAKASKLLEGDKFEGSFPQNELDFIIKWYDEYRKKQGNPCTKKDLEMHAESWRREFEEQRNCNFINCWHYNDVESVALWKVYSGNTNGIALQSSFNSFRESFKDYKKDVYIGEVKYLDYERGYYYDVFKENRSFNLLLPFITKRKNFEYEKEYRAIISINDEFELSTMKNQNGIYVPVNISTLIEKIIVSPGSPEWFFEIVKDVMAKYELEKPIEKSVLNREPFDFKI